MFSEETSVMAQVKPRMVHQRSMDQPLPKDGKQYKIVKKARNNPVKKENPIN